MRTYTRYFKTGKYTQYKRSLIKHDPRRCNFHVCVFDYSSIESGAKQDSQKCCNSLCSSVIQAFDWQGYDKTDNDLFLRLLSNVPGMPTNSGIFQVVTSVKRSHRINWLIKNRQFYLNGKNLIQTWVFNRITNINWQLH